MSNWPAARLARRTAPGEAGTVAREAREPLASLLRPAARGAASTVTGVARQPR